MKTVKIVIGSSFGDEGKGLMTDYFAKEAKEQNKSCLVVCHNGGSQKAHTFVSPNGIRHVFHHFGSGSFEGADTYLSSEYIVNPIIFNKEYAELKRKSAITDCYMDTHCRLTTPFDMLINQIIEEYRGENKHGSCGLGIFETIYRNTIPYKGVTVYEFACMSSRSRWQFLEELASAYVPDRLKQLGVKQVSTKWLEILSNKEAIIENFIKDFTDMMDRTTLTNEGIIEVYDYIIFEGAQGLLLDQDNVEYMPHLTPSNTGIKNPMDIIGNRKADIEACYVSRTYMTRHGAGRFDTECRKEDINEKIIDLTNVPNPFQDSLRYGTLDLKDLKERIEKDLNGAKVKKSIAITHCNEYPIDVKELDRLFDSFGIYLSDGMTHNDVCKRR